MENSEPIKETIMSNFIAVRHSGNVDTFKAENEVEAKDYMHRRYGLFWYHHYKLFKGEEVK